MRFKTWATSRALITVAATGATMSFGLLFGAAPAGAHVRVDADHAVPGTTSVLSITLPDVPSARAEVMPGWTARLDRDPAAGTVRSVTWTTAPGTGISSDQFALFRIAVKLPDQHTVSFPARQTYSDGTVVRWDQTPLPDGGEPEHPAPVLTLSAAEVSMTADNSARWLAGGALTVAGVAVAATLRAWRRT